MKRTFLLALVITGFVYSACDDDDDGDNVMLEVDRNFVMNASESNLAEIEMGELAAMKGTSPEVISFGEMMVTEHQTALDDLDSVAENKDVSMATELNAKHQALKQRLSTMSGYSFDTAYMRSQVMDHETAEALFEDHVNNGRDEQVKGYSTKYLPHIRMHLEEATSILSSLEQ
jgi:putative membrane protein